MPADRDPKLTVRASKQIQDDAKATLTENGWGVQEFVVACLVAVMTDPAAFLPHLEPHRIEPGKRGRPRKTPSVEPEPPGAS